MATIKITVKQLKKLIAEQLEYENFFEKNIKELNEQVKFWDKLKESAAFMGPEGSLERSDWGSNPKATKQVAAIIAANPLLRKLAETTPNFDLQEFVSISDGGTQHNENLPPELSKQHFDFSAKGIEAQISNALVSYKKWKQSKRQ